MPDAYVIDAVRTPFGRYGGALAGVRPDDLAAHVVRTVVERSPGLDPAAIEPARNRLRQEIGAGATTDSSSRRARAMGRAIEIMSPSLTSEERLQAVRDLVPLLGQDIDAWSAKAIPRALATLLPTLDSGQAAEAAKALPPAIAMTSAHRPSCTDTGSVSARISFTPNRGLVILGPKSPVVTMCAG